MSLSKHQLEQIEHYLIQHGLDILEVREDVLDHICCTVEQAMVAGDTFEFAFAQAQLDFLPDDITRIQTDTLYFLTFKSSLMMVKGIFISAYVTVACFAASLGFTKFFVVFTDTHLAGMMSALFEVLAVMAFCGAFLPLLFIYGYRRFTHNLLMQE